MVMHSALTHLIHAVLTEAPGGLQMLSDYLEERGDKRITDLGPPRQKLATLLTIWPEGAVGCDFAEHVLPRWNAAYPNDDRPRAAIDAKRRWLAKKIEEPELMQATHEAKAAMKHAFSQGNYEMHAVAAAAHAAAQIPCLPALAARFAQNSFRGREAPSQQAAEIRWQLEHLTRIVAP